MFIVLLRLTEHKDKAPQFMDGHTAWIQRGMDDGVFMLVGSLEPKAGGAILAHGTARAALEARVKEDPFVAEGVVSAEIIEVTPARTDARLRFLAA